MLNNKDGNYLVGAMANRYDESHKEIVTKCLLEMNLQLVYDKMPGYLFSHSGVLPRWITEYELNVHDLNSIPFDDQSLMSISPYRGWGNNVGSCIWGDVREYDKSYHYSEWYQIFGHTQLVDAIINKDYACLDCRKAFVLDTETKEIKEYGE